MSLSSKCYPASAGAATRHRRQSVGQEETYCGDFIGLKLILWGPEGKHEVVPKLELRVKLKGQVQPLPESCHTFLSPPCGKPARVQILLSIIPEKAIP